MYNSVAPLTTVLVSAFPATSVTEDPLAITVNPRVARVLIPAFPVTPLSPRVTDQVFPAPETDAMLGVPVTPEPFETLKLSDVSPITLSLKVTVNETAEVPIVISEAPDARAIETVVGAVLSTVTATLL